MQFDGQRHASAALPPINAGTQSTRSWVGLRAGLDICGNSRLTNFPSPDRTALSESPYRLSYPGLQYGGPNIQSFRAFKFDLWNRY